MIQIFAFLLLFSCLMEGAWARVPTLWNEFSQNQRELLIAGKPVLCEEDVPDSAAEFRLRMPFFLPEEVYVSRVVLNRIHTGGYEITWSVNQSLYAKSCRGGVLIEPHDGKTLLIYRNLVIPKGDFAGFLRFPAVLRQKESVNALVRQILLEKGQHAELLARQQKELSLALGELEK